MSVSVQAEPFDTGAEIGALMAGDHRVGGLAVFLGLVRDLAGDDRVTAMTLEHYPGMTESAIVDMVAQARARWPLLGVRVIHRFGRLLPGDPIVLVAVTSAHRDAAFDACRFLIDWLKTEAPFWKLEDTGDGTHWVDARDSDDAARKRWLAD